MATSALATWRDCLLGLERAFLTVSDSSIPDIGHARSAACSALKSAIRKQRSLPKSTWHKLVAELQVPLRVSSICKDAILLQLDAASTTSALSVLVAFLTAASQIQTPLGQAKASKVLLAIQQQVQQSGLLECLPQLYLSTAEALRSAATLRKHRRVKDTAKAAAGDTCSSSPCATAAGLSSSTSTSGLNGDGNPVTDDGSDISATVSDSAASTDNFDSSSNRSDSSDSGHNSIRQLEAYSDLLLPLYVQLSKLFPLDVTSLEGGSRVPAHTAGGADSLAACSIAAAQLVFAVLCHSAGPYTSKQVAEPYSSMLDNLSDKAALALSALSVQLSVMVVNAAPSLASLDSAATQLLLSPNFMLSLSYLTVLTALTAMYVEQSDFEHTPGIQQQLVFNRNGGAPASASSAASSSSGSSNSTSTNSSRSSSSGSSNSTSTNSSRSSSSGSSSNSTSTNSRRSSSSGSSSNSTSTNSSRRSSASQSEDVEGGNADGDPGEQRLNEYGWHKLFPGMGPYHSDMLKPFGISVPSLLWPAMLRPDSHALINYSGAAEMLLAADTSMLLVWMYNNDVQQHQRQAVQPYLQLMVQCLMLPCVLAQWAPGSTCRSFMINPLSKLVQATPANTPPHPAADTLMSAGCNGSAMPQHSQVEPHSSPAPDAAAAGGADDLEQPLVVVDAQQITAQVLADHESFVRSLTKFDLLAKKSYWMDAALCNIAALCHNVHRSPLACWARVSGHNSPEQQQLHSLCCNMLKLSASRMSWRDDTANQLRWAAATCSAALATAAIPDDADMTNEIYAAHGMAAAAFWGNLGSNTGSSHCNPDDQAASSAGSNCSYSNAASESAAAARLSTVSSMPSLVIFGCCCLQASQQLKEQIPVILQQRLGLLKGQPMLRGQPGCPFPPQNSRPFTDAAGACLEPKRQPPVPANDPLGTLSLLAHTVLLLGAALDSDGVRVDGSELLAQELQQLSAAAMAAIKTRQANAAPLAALVKQLRVTGLVCCSHPVAPMCNNPSCTTTRGDTELELVTGKSCMCGGCRVAHYCCRACQQEHWELHKPACKALVPAEAAAAAK